MSHELDITNDQASFVSARKDAWHQLGTTLDHTFTAEEAMQYANLGGWDVRKAPLTALTDDGVLEVPDKYATVRTNPVNGGTDYLGVVGESYTPIQNEAHCELLNTLVDESGAHFETAGALKGGREVFVTMEIPQHINVGGVDPVDMYIAALNSHDGSSAFRFIVTPIRVVCANTQAAALKNAESTFKARHTANSYQIAAQAREVTDITFNYLGEFQEQADRMINEQLTESKFREIMRDVFPVESSPSKQALTRQAKRVDDLSRLFVESDTNTEIRGTRWAGYQAITEYADHFAPVQSETANAADVRAQRTLTAQSTTKLKRRAFDLLSV